MLWIISVGSRIRGLLELEEAGEEGTEVLGVKGGLRLSLHGWVR